MTSADVTALVRTLAAAGINIWIDGGWAVDALLERPAREHSDLDIVIEERHVPAMRAVLEGRGYRDVPRDDSHRWNFVLGDEHGRQVDVHVVVLDELGNVVDGLAYPTESLAGTGTIDGRVVQCIEPRHLVKFHSGYPIRDKDRHDVALLCERFGIEVPEAFR